MTVTGYGKRVIGEEAFAHEQRVVHTKAEIYGPRVVDTYGKRVIDEKAPDQALSMSVPKLQAALAANPAILDALIEAEFARDVPRRTAVRALLEVEARKDEPRPEVVARLDGALSTQHPTPADPEAEETPEGEAPEA
jgi:hypothetical protein